MTIELQFNSVRFNYEELQEQFPELAMMIQSSLPAKKPHKRKSRKKRKTVGILIDEIQENLK